MHNGKTQSIPLLLPKKPTKLNEAIAITGVGRIGGRKIGFVGRLSIKKPKIPTGRYELPK